MNASWPGPVPAPDDVVIQAALLEAVHGQPAAVVTVTAPLAPVPGTSCTVGEIEFVPYTTDYVFYKADR